MHLQSLELSNFRNYKEAQLDFVAHGVTVIIGDNGQGKTNLLEAIGLVSSLRSFRQSDTAALIGNLGEQTVVRAKGVRSQRQLDIDIELNTGGRTRAFVNKQPLRRVRDIDDALVATVFSPEDLQLVKGGPAERRRYVDEVLVDTSASTAALAGDFDRVLRQRNTLLKQAAGRLTEEIGFTLDVWDAQLADKGERLTAARRELVTALSPVVADTYRMVAARPTLSESLTMEMVSEWQGPEGLAGALADNRRNDVKRGVTTIGPHRDDVVLRLNDMAARTHASQGEQRTLALALRLAAHRYMTEVLGAPPLLLLDDVLSELDANRVAGLLEALPTGQTFLTTASPVSDALPVAAEVRIIAGAVS